MVKRKAEEPPQNDNWTNRRRTRSSGLLSKPLVTLPASSPSPSLSPRASPKPTLASQPTKPLPRPLPSHLVPHLHSQKRAVLHALQHPPLTEHESSLYPEMFNQLVELVNGTTQRHEGNSCLVLGPRGSGKSRVSKYFCH